MAILNITWSGQNGDLVEEIDYDTPDQQIFLFATESVQNGEVPGITADPEASFTDFVIQRFPAVDGKPDRVFLRPKVPFGGGGPQ